MVPRSPARTLTGTNAGTASEHNRRVILHSLRMHGPLSRAGLARRTGLTKQTVSNIIEELGKAALVEELAAVREGRGKPATPYRLAPDGAFAIGLHLDRHVARLVLVDLVGKMRLSETVPLPQADPEAGLDILAGMVDRARSRLAGADPGQARRLIGIGVAMPGPFGPDARGDDAFAMGRWQSFPLAARLARATGLDVAVQNDAAAATTAERLVGAAHGIEHAVCLYLGYGLGAGLILRGELYHGRHGNSGEIGLVHGIGAETAPLDRTASVASLCAALGIAPDSDRLFDAVDRAMASGGAALDGWLSDAGRHLAWAVGLVERLFDPETVILCGTVPRALLEALVARIVPLLPPGAGASAPSRLQIGLADPWSVAVGAAAEPIARCFDPRHAALLKAAPDAGPGPAT